MAVNLVVLALCSCFIATNGQFILSFGTPTPASPNNLSPTTPAPPCVDKLPNCDQYDKSVCTSADYRTWAKDNCRFFCRNSFCDPAEIARLEAMTTTIAPENCKDRVDCRNYGPNACSDQFKGWSMDNCPLHCGYCTGPPTVPPACEDRIPNCKSYDGDTCTNPNYKLWVEDNCRKFCGLCSGSGSSGTVFTPAPPRPANPYPTPAPMGSDVPTMVYVPPTPLPGKRDENSHALLKRQFHASHNHHTTYNCFDAEGNLLLNDTNCQSQAPSESTVSIFTGVTAVPGAIEGSFPGEEFKPHTKPDNNWDYRPSTQSPDTTTLKEKPITQTPTTETPITTTTTQAPTTESPSTTTPISSAPTTSAQTSSAPTTASPLTTTTTKPPEPTTTVTDATTTTTMPAPATLSSTTTTTMPTPATLAPPTTTTIPGPTTAEPTTSPPTTAAPPPTTTTAATTTTTKATTTEAPTTTSTTTASTTTTLATSPSTTTVPSVTTLVPQEKCKDTVDNCIQYGTRACHDLVYRPWAINHCPLFCGFCTPGTPVPCVNKVENCAEFDSGDLCTKDTYFIWANENCFAYCGFGTCTTTTATTTTKPHGHQGNPH